MYCDAHVHIVDEHACHPQIAGRRYLAGVASAADLRRAAAASGVTRFVVVQPSFYGTDNTVTLEALDALGDDGRGVAVVDSEATTLADVRAMGARGVRGFRINLYSLAGDDGSGFAATFAKLAALAQGIDGHVQVIAPMPVLLSHADLLARAPVPVVIDHYGLPAGSPREERGRALLDLVRQPHVWVKLSAPYRSGDDPLSVTPDPVWLAAMLEACADRCVWGSDWPHTPTHDDQHGPDQPAPYRPLSYAALVDNFRKALPDAATAERVLALNPQRLYGFASGAL